MTLFNTPTKEPKKKSAPVAAAATKDLYAGDVATAEKKTAKAKTSNAYRVLLRPIISENASKQQTHNQYFFQVALSANKIEVAKAVKDVYGIAPTKVNMVRVEGKVIRTGRITGRRKDWKKAIVTLPEGKTISLYEGV